jgi:hypothetical protein
VVLVLKHVRSLRSALCKVGGKQAKCACEGGRHADEGSRAGQHVQRHFPARCNDISQQRAPVHHSPWPSPLTWQPHPTRPLPPFPFLQTGIMTTTDLLITFSDDLLPHLDVGGPAKPLTSMLGQLLLKASSNEKRFVVDEAQRALGTMAEVFTATRALALFSPYVEHKNPKLRARAGGAVLMVVEHMRVSSVRGRGGGGHARAMGCYALHKCMLHGSSLLRLVNSQAPPPPFLSPWSSAPMASRRCCSWRAS